MTEKTMIVNNYKVRFDENGNCFAEPSEAYEKDAKEARLKAVEELAQLPFAYQKKRLKDINPDFYKNKDGITRIFMQIQDYISGFDKKKEDGTSLYIWSHMCGSGKTMTACAIANEIIAQGYSVIFMTPGQMLTKLQSTFRGKSEHSMEDILNSFQKCDLLIFDDFCTENRTGWSDNIIYEVINGRYLNRKPVLYTSNFDMTEIPYKRVSDRIKERCIEIHWPEEGTRSAIGKMNALKQQKEYEQISFTK